ncbi:MAG TPA: NAD(P)/FAD-dependent oxidoreductase [Pyrinomonadaceae bacterium]|jgi:hypothetical protein
MLRNLAALLDGMKCTNGGNRKRGECLCQFFAWQVRVPGLYFIGEVVDVTGQLGGYNFQWAWPSAFTAGRFV